MNPPIKILLYEDKDPLRETLALLIGSTEGFEVAGAFDNCETVAEDLRVLDPDVVLMDIDMPGTNGVEGVRRIRMVNEKVRILMLTVFEDNENIFEALKAGANGYLLKKTTPQRLLEHIREVHAGGSPMTASVATQVLQLFAQLHRSGHTDYHLSDREKEVLQLLVDGNSYKLVAASLDISLDTVRSHIRSIYEKLHVNSKSEAVAKAIRNRIV